MNEQSLQTRFLDKILVDDGCWRWVGCTNDPRNAPGGYGRFGIEGKNELAHRVSYSIFVAPVPKGLCVCHHCDNPSCVKPAHLFIGTHEENMADCSSKKRLGERRGERNGRAKLTASDVLIIRGLLRDGRTQKSIAEEYGISQSNVSFINLGETWKVDWCLEQLDTVTLEESNTDTEVENGSKD